MRNAVPVVFWAVLLAGLATLLALWTGDLVEAVLLPGAVLVVLGGRRSRPMDPQSDGADTSRNHAQVGTLGS